MKQQVEEAEEGDVLELDECWSFVQRKSNKKWLWVALCRRTRQIVAFVIGDRSAKTCARLWAKIPESYKQKQSFSDFWKAYGVVFSEDWHDQVEKKTGETSHVERFFNTLRQRVSRYVRKTLSFSKRERMHHLVTKLFITKYNEEIALTI